jgi:Mg2+ and Co2+ transporter CorA
MRISVWKDGRLRDASLDELKAIYGLPTWIDVADPTTEDLGKIADTLDIPKHVLIGKLRLNYPPADSY